MHNTRVQEVKETLNYKPFRKYDPILNNRTGPFKTRCESLVEVWSNVAKYDFVNSDLEHLIQIMDWAKLHTLDIILNAEWINEFKEQYGDSLVNAVRDAQNKMVKVSTTFRVRCEKLIDVITNPWNHPTLVHLLQTPDAEVGQKEIEFFCSETTYLISVRLKKLCESQCEDLALNLVQAFMKSYRRSQNENFNLNASNTQVWFIFDIYVALLLKFKEADTLMEVLKGLSLQEGLNLVRRFAKKRVTISKIWKNSQRIAVLGCHMYISSAMIKPMEETKQVLTNLLKAYVSLCSTDSYLQHLKESIRSIIRLAETASQIYIFCDVFLNQFGLRMKAFNIELYIRALTTDMNTLERQKTDSEFDKMPETTERLARGFTDLTDILIDDVTAARECILTAFSLEPTLERLHKIKELARRCGLNVLDTEAWKCELHPPILPSDEVAWKCLVCDDWMCKPQLNVPLTNTNTALNEALTEEKLGITRELCDDLVVLISCPRYQAFSWLLEWENLHRLCVMYLNNPERTKDWVTELKFVQIDYLMFMHIKQEPLDEYAGIEKGYEKFLDLNFSPSDEEETSNDTPTTSSVPLVQPKSDPATLKSLRMFRPNLKRPRPNPETEVPDIKVFKTEDNNFDQPGPSSWQHLAPSGFGTPENGFNSEDNNGDHGSDLRKNSSSFGSTRQSPRQYPPQSGVTGQSSRHHFFRSELAAQSPRQHPSSNGVSEQYSSEVARLSLRQNSFLSGESGSSSKPHASQSGDEELSSRQKPFLSEVNGHSLKQNLCTSEVFGQNSTLNISLSSVAGQNSRQNIFSSGVAGQGLRQNPLPPGVEGQSWRQNPSRSAVNGLSSRRSSSSSEVARESLIQNSSSSEDERQSPNNFFHRSGVVVLSPRQLMSPSRFAGQSSMRNSSLSGVVGNSLEQNPSPFAVNGQISRRSLSPSGVDLESSIHTSFPPEVGGPSLNGTSFSFKVAGQSYEETSCSSHDEGQSLKQNSSLCEVSVLGSRENPSLSDFAGQCSRGNLCLFESLNENLSSSGVNGQSSSENFSQSIVVRQSSGRNLSPVNDDRENSNENSFLSRLNSTQNESKSEDDIKSLNQHFCLSGVTFHSPTKNASSTGFVGESSRENISLFQAEGQSVNENSPSVNDKRENLSENFALSRLNSTQHASTSKDEEQILNQISSLSRVTVHCSKRNTSSSAFVGQSLKGYSSTLGLSDIDPESSRETSSLFGVDGESSSRNTSLSSSACWNDVVTYYGRNLQPMGPSIINSFEEKYLMRTLEPLTLCSSPENNRNETAFGTNVKNANRHTKLREIQTESLSESTIDSKNALVATLHQLGGQVATTTQSDDSDDDRLTILNKRVCLTECEILGHLTAETEKYSDNSTVLDCDELLKIDATLPKDLSPTKSTDLFGSVFYASTSEGSKNDIIEDDNNVLKVGATLPLPETSQLVDPKLLDDLASENHKDLLLKVDAFSIENDALSPTKSNNICQDSFYESSLETNEIPVGFTALTEETNPNFIVLDNELLKIDSILPGDGTLSQSLSPTKSSDLFGSVPDDSCSETLEIPEDLTEETSHNCIVRDRNELLKVDVTLTEDSHVKTETKHHTDRKVQNDLFSVNCENSGVFYNASLKIDDMLPKYDTLSPSKISYLLGSVSDNSTSETIENFIAEDDNLLEVDDTLSENDALSPTKSLLNDLEISDDSNLESSDNFVVQARDKTLKVDLTLPEKDILSPTKSNPIVKICNELTLESIEISFAQDHNKLLKVAATLPENHTLSLFETSDDSISESSKDSSIQDCNESLKVDSSLLINGTLSPIKSNCESSDNSSSCDSSSETSEKSFVQDVDNLKIAAELPEIVTLSPTESNCLNNILPRDGTLLHTQTKFIISKILDDWSTAASANSVLDRDELLQMDAVLPENDCDNPDAEENSMVVAEMSDDSNTESSQTSLVCDTKDLDVINDTQTSDTESNNINILDNINFSNTGSPSSAEIMDYDSDESTVLVRTKNDSTDSTTSDSTTSDNKLFTLDGISLYPDFNTLELPEFGAGFYVERTDLDETQVEMSGDSNTESSQTSLVSDTQTSDTEFNNNNISDNESDESYNRSAAASATHLDHTYCITDREGEYQQKSIKRFKLNDEITCGVRISRPSPFRETSTLSTESTLDDGPCSNERFQDYELNAIAGRRTCIFYHERNRKQLFRSRGEHTEKKLLAKKHSERGTDVKENSTLFNYCSPHDALDNENFDPNLSEVGKHNSNAALCSAALDKPELSRNFAEVSEHSSRASECPPIYDIRNVQGTPFLVLNNSSIDTSNMDQTCFSKGGEHPDSRNRVDECSPGPSNSRSQISHSSGDTDLILSTDDENSASRLLVQDLLMSETSDESRQPTSVDTGRSYTIRSIPEPEVENTDIQKEMLEDFKRDAFYFNPKNGYRMASFNFFNKYNLNAFPIACFEEQSGDDEFWLDFYTWPFGHCKLPKRLDPRRFPTMPGFFRRFLDEEKKKQLIQSELYHDSTNLVKKTKKIRSRSCSHSHRRSRRIQEIRRKRIRGRRELSRRTRGKRKTSKKNFREKDPEVIIRDVRIVVDKTAVDVFQKQKEQQESMYADQKLSSLVPMVQLQRLPMKLAPKISLPRPADKSYAQKVLSNVPGLRDYQNIIPSPITYITNVAQTAGGRINPTVAAPSTQTSTQVTPHIQRIGQPRNDKPQSDQSNNTESIATSVISSPPNSAIKPSTSQPSTLINILSQQIIRPGQSNCVRTRPSPLINILSQQIIKPSTQVVTKTTTAPVASTDVQVNNIKMAIGTSSDQLVTTNVAKIIATSTSTVTALLTTTTATNTIVKSVACTTTSAPTPTQGTILQFICKSALPKFQQAFGKPVYQSENASENASTSNENSSTTTSLTTDKKATVKNASVNIQPIQGSVIYTRQVPVGQTINLIPPGRGQVFRIATSNPDQISLVKDTVIHSKMSALLAAALQGKKSAENPDNEGSTEDLPNRITVARPTLVQNARIVKPVIQIPSNVIRTSPQTNMSSTTLEQLREFDMVFKQVKERSNTSAPSESAQNEANEASPPRISVTYLNQGQKFTQLAPVVVVSSNYCSLQPAASPALSVTSQGSSSPCVTPAATPTLPKVSSKSSKGKTVKTTTTHASKSSPIPKPQQKPQEDEHTTQRIFDILAEYAEQLRNSPDLNNKPAPRRRSNPPTNPSHNSKRKKSSNSKKSGQGSGIVSDDTDDQRTMGSEDSSCGIVLNVKDDEQPQNQTTESNDSSTSSRQLILTETSTATRNLIITDTSGETLKIPSTAVLVPGNYIMPVSMVKGGQQIAVVSGGSKILATVPARSGPNMLLFQSFINQNRKTGLPTVKYSTLQPLSGISSQSLAGVSAQPPVILPNSHNLTAVTLGQSLTLNKSDEGRSTELLLTIAQPRDNNRIPDSSGQPDSSTGILRSNLAGKLEHAVIRTDASEKILTFQKSIITTPIATPVISQASCIKVDDSSDGGSPHQNIITLNVQQDQHKDGVKSVERVQSVLVATCTSNGPMLSHTPPRYRKPTIINHEVAMHNGEKQNNNDQKHYQSGGAVYFANKSKKISNPVRLDRELQQLCLQRKQAALEREIRLQKSLSEECEDLGVDEPSTSDLFPEADLLFDSNHSPSFDQSSPDLIKKHSSNSDVKESGKGSSITLFSDDDNSTSLRTDFLFDSVEYHTETDMRYEDNKMTNGQSSSTSNESGYSCEDTTLLQNCASMSDVTINAPISPTDFSTAPSVLNKYKFKYSNRKRSEKQKLAETWSAEVSSSEDTTGSTELGKRTHSPDMCANDKPSHHGAICEGDLSDNGYKVVRVAISKADLISKDDESCEDSHCEDDVDSTSGRGARRSVKKLCSCCNGTQDGGSRKRPSSRPHTPAPHKKAFLNKKR